MKKPKTLVADMRWFRLYHDVMDDEKVQGLPAELFKFWVNLLCLASKGEPRGRVPSKASTIAFRLRVTPTKAKSMLDKLESLTLIDREDEATYVMHNWDERQKKSDSGADRQKGWRDRHRNGDRNVTDNATVTGQEKEIASQSDKEAASQQSTHRAERSVRAPQQTIIRPPTPDLRENNGPGRDSPEAIELATWAEQFGSDPRGESYAVYVRATCDYVPTIWLRALLQRKVEGATKKPNIALLRSIMKAWVEAGECEFLVRPGAIRTTDPDAQLKREREALNARYGDPGNG